MQGQRSSVGSFSETSNTDPESISDNTGMNEQAYWNNFWNPVESRFPFYGGIGSDPQNHGNDDPMEVDHGWASSYDPVSGAGLSSGERLSEPANTLFPGRFNMGPINDQVMRRPLFSRSSSPAPQNVNQSSPTMGAVGTSSDAPENNGGGSSSLSDWGLSYKRKAFEGTSSSRQPYDGESSSSSHYNASGGLSLSPPSWSSENPARSIGLRLSQGTRHDPIPFNLSSMGSSRRLNLPLPQLSARPIPSGDSSYSTASGDGGGGSIAPQGQSRVTRLPRNAHPWNGSSNLRAGTSNEGAALQDEPNSRTFSRNNVEDSAFAAPSETRNSAHDPTNWSLATTGHISSTGGVPSSSRAGPSSGARHNSQTRNRQPIGEFFPDQSLFPSIDSELGGHSGQLPQLPSGPPGSSRETTMSSRLRHVRNRPYPRPAFLVEAHSDDDDVDDDDLEPPSLQDLAVDIEGRHRLISEIRQVLGAMRRGENLRAEDFLLIDPFIYPGMADLHDRHRDMRLDVDNMSYEELLALGERIGDVSTGLSEEAIFKSMKQHQFMSFATETPTDLKPCCICQEQYVGGDDLGTLDCGHDFHTDCVKQWLMQKNLCPICKTKALQT